MNWGLGRGRRRERGQVVHCVRHSVQPDHGAQFAEVVSGMPRARQTHGDYETAVRPVRQTRAGFQTTAVQAPAAAWHLHQSRRSRRHGYRASARRPPAARTYQSGRSHAQSYGQRNCISKETSKMQPTTMSLSSVVARHILTLTSTLHTSKYYQRSLVIHPDNSWM